MFGNLDKNKILYKGDDFMILLNYEKDFFELKKYGFIERDDFWVKNAQYYTYRISTKNRELSVSSIEGLDVSLDNTLINLFNDNFLIKECTADESLEEEGFTSSSQDDDYITFHKDVAKGEIVLKFNKDYVEYQIYLINKYGRIENVDVDLSLHKAILLKLEQLESDISN